MLFKGLSLGLAAAAMLGLSGQAQAQTSSVAPIYQPPLRGTTVGGRIGGGTRGTGDQTITMSVFAPEHPGLTVSEQPRLYWYLSEDVDIGAELTVVDRQSADPLLELSLAAPIKRGIHALDLGRHGVRLEPGMRYEWFVALVVDPNQRSNDIIAGGEIERVAPDAALESRLEEAGQDGQAAVYARAGIWYDAVDAVSRWVDGSPTAPVPREQRAALLDQVGLDEAAAYDRQFVPPRAVPGEGPG